MQLIVQCAMCGMEKTIDIPTDNVGLTKQMPTLRQIIRRAKWKVQVNGANFDIYCSTKCAR